MRGPGPVPGDERDAERGAVASWLNLVEIFFSILTKRLLRRGEFTSRDHLAGKILKFIAHYSRTAKPFRWRYNGRPLSA